MRCSQHQNEHVPETTNAELTQQAKISPTTSLPFHQPVLAGNMEESIIEYEKCKLGQELHDGVNPLLSAAILYLNLIKPVSKRSKKVKDTVHTILIEAIECIRHLAADLVLIEQEKYDLRRLVENHIERIKNIGLFSVEVDIENTEILSRLSKQEKINLYRIIQEQINNIIKYSKAKKVSIQLKTEPEGLYLRIQDDGIGFDMNQAKNGIGLLNMKRRMEQLHGILNIESSPGKGCIIYVYLPPHEEDSSHPMYSY
jgi:signal transduction histidine kinase